MSTVRADALVLVDMQRAFVSGPKAIPQSEAVRAAVESLLDRARSGGSLIVYLQNDGPIGSPDEPGSSGWTLAVKVHPDETVIRKQEDDGFAGTDLGALLERHPAHTLVVCGVQSEMCVAATARGAMARGLTVVLPRDAHGTYPIPPHEDNGVAVPAAQVARVAEWSLGDELVAVDTSDKVQFSPAGPGARSLA